MTALRAPGWIRIVSAATGGAALVLSGVCFFGPELVFGADAYHLLTRVATGLLGALASGLGVAAVTAAAEGDPVALRPVVRAQFIAAALIPPVVIYNIGAFNQTDPTGFRAFAIAGGVILIVCLPLLLSLRVLNRVRRAVQRATAPQARRSARVGPTMAE